MLEHLTVLVTGVEGVYMIRGDGVKRQTHPIFAAFVGDYPQKVLAAARNMLQNHAVRVSKPFSCTRSSED
jgi:hypothetical protein